METYHKIQTLFKRYQDGPNRGKMIRGQWTTPELEYLAGNQWEFTEKVDGTNIRILAGGGWSEPKFAGRSDNATIPIPLKRHLEDTFTTELFEKAGLDNIILFGEGYGPKIQGGWKYRDDHSFVLFDVKIGDWWLDRSDVDDIAGKLGIDSVPTIGTGTLHDAVDIVTEGLSSEWGGIVGEPNEFEAEGIVARPVVPMFDRKGNRIITKIKAVDFR